MSISKDIVGRKLSPSVFNFNERDVMIYALGVGAGESDKELKYVFEQELQVLPTFGTIPQAPLQAKLTQIKGLDINVAMAVHGEQYLEVLKYPLPVRGKLTTVPVVTALHDQGTGALIDMELDTFDENNEKILFNRFSTFVRGEGGFGGNKAPRPGNEPPSRPPDKIVELKTTIQQAMLYRLSGDYHLIHIDPLYASRGGFNRPILHGLCTFGFAARAVISELLDNDPSRFKAMKVRFAHHVFPGETIIVEMWRESQTKIVFKCVVAEREKNCITNAAIWLTC